MKPHILGILIGIVIWVPSIRADADVDENSTVHVLHAGDTLDKDGGKAAEIDLQLMYCLFRDSISAERLKLYTPLTGDGFTRENILNFYKKLRVGEKDAVVLFYTGHGAWDPQNGPYLSPRDARQEPLWRAELRNAMVSCGGRLTVLLTNCCASWAIPRVGAFGRDEEGYSAAFPRKAISPLMRDLFCRHKGVVDITGAKKGTAACFTPDGSFFPLALHAILQCSPYQLDSNRDGFISWENVFRAVCQQTDSIFFSRTSEETRKQAGQDSQIPEQFGLGERIGSSRSDYAGPRRLPKTVATTIFNPTPDPIIYEFRWGKESYYSWFVVPPDCYIRHLLKVPEVAEAPVPEVRYPRRASRDWINGPEAQWYLLRCGEVEPKNPLGELNFFQWEKDPNGIPILNLPCHPDPVNRPVLPGKEPPLLGTTIDWLREGKRELMSEEQRKARWSKLQR